MTGEELATARASLKAGLPDLADAAAVRAAWEACGPWVPEDSLTEEGKAIRAAFVEMLADDRLAKQTGKA